MEPNAIPSTEAITEILSVDELTELLRQTIYSRFSSPLWIAGEVSNVSRALSGHSYFTLKGKKATLQCALWFSRNLAPPQTGEFIEAFGTLSIYPPRSTYQLDVITFRLAGTGAWYQRFLAIKTKLEAEGLFASERKRPLPLYPRRIALITSREADALRDVMRTLQNRAPMIKVFLFPTLVQGGQAPQAIAQAIKQAAHRAAALRFDLMLIVRGGGSAEDLAAFNEEIVARAIAASPIPVVTGIGHETDFTIADFVADLRASTPTAAAMVISEHWNSAPAILQTAATRLQRAFTYTWTTWEQRLDFAARDLKRVTPQRAIKQAAQLLTTQEERLKLHAVRLLHALRQMLNQAAARLLHPRDQLAIRRNRCDQLAKRLAAKRPHLIDYLRVVEKANTRLHAARPDLSSLQERRNALYYRLERARPNPAQMQSSVAALEAKLTALSPVSVLARGYVLALDPQSLPITAAATLKLPTEALLVWHDGAIAATLHKPASNHSIAHLLHPPLISE